MEVFDGTSINTSHLASTWRAKVKARESIKKKEAKREEDRKNHKRNTVLIKDQICNHTCVKYTRTHLLRLCRGPFSLKNSIYLPVLDILSFHPTHFSLVFQPTLYKFIALGFLGLRPFFLGWVLKLVLTHVVRGREVNCTLHWILILSTATFKHTSHHFFFFWY